MQEAKTESMVKSIAQWRDRYAFLVWSNPGADDSVYLRAALLDPHLFILLDALAVFRLDRLQSEWSRVKETDEGRKVAWYVESMLENFARGLRDDFVE